MVLWSEGSEVQSDSEEGSKRERADERITDVRESEMNHEEKEEDKNDYKDDDSNANTGWAEAMGKILGKKTTDTKSSILVKDKSVDKTNAKEKQEQQERKTQVLNSVLQSQAYLLLDFFRRLKYIKTLVFISHCPCVNSALLFFNPLPVNNNIYRVRTVAGNP